ncbi:MAG: DinB family protein [Candidatus Zixiibacteriota bacterium]|nr:MAG: DinB family protein [candidate division Zixibacteria bacterium]
MPKKRIDPQIAQLVRLLEQAFNRRAWHGANFLGSLRGLTTPRLLWKPAPNRHNIWEIALHIAYWKYAVYRRMVNAPKGSFPRGPSDWPSLPAKPDRAAWKSDLSLLVNQHRLLIQAVQGLSASKLNRTPPKTKCSYLTLLQGIASHDVYHAGQVQLLKRLQKK